MQYTPDFWQVVKLSSDSNPTHYRVFGAWRGGYLDGDSWKMNSGIVSAKLVDDYYEFIGSSGSVYRCHKKCYGNTMYGESVLNDLIEKSKGVVNIEIMPEDIDFLTLNYD